MLDTNRKALVFSLCILIPALLLFWRSYKRGLIADKELRQRTIVVTDVSKYHRWVLKKENKGRYPFAADVSAKGTLDGNACLVLGYTPSQKGCADFGLKLNEGNIDILALRDTVPGTNFDYYSHEAYLEYFPQTARKGDWK